MSKPTEFNGVGMALSPAEKGRITRARREQLKLHSSRLALILSEFEDPKRLLNLSVADALQLAIHLRLSRQAFALLLNELSTPHTTTQQP